MNHCFTALAPFLTWLSYVPNADSVFICLLSCQGGEIDELMEGGEGDEAPSDESERVRSQESKNLIWTSDWAVHMCQLNFVTVTDCP